MAKEEFKYRVNSEHLGYDDPGLSAARKKYTSFLWPFGREERARDKLTEKQDKILEAHEIESSRALGGKITLTLEAETKEEADNKMGKFKRDLENFYKDELELDESEASVEYEYSGE